MQNPSVSLPQSTPLASKAAQFKSQHRWMLKHKKTSLGLMENKSSTSPWPTEDRQCPLMPPFGASRGSGAVWALNLMPCLRVHGQASCVGAKGGTRCKQLPLPSLYGHSPPTPSPAVPTCPQHCWLYLIMSGDSSSRAEACWAPPLLSSLFLLPDFVCVFLGRCLSFPLETTNKQTRIKQKTHNHDKTDINRALVGTV